MSAAKISSFRRASLAAAILGASAGVMSAASAAPSAADIVATRKASFKKMGAAVKALKEQLGQAAPSKAALTANAAIVEATARDQGKLFPAGTGPGAGIQTDALANIWTDRATFDSLMSQMVAQTAKLRAATDGGDIVAIRAQFKVTGEACAACHRKFRSDD